MTLCIASKQSRNNRCVEGSTRIPLADASRSSRVAIPMRAVAALVHLDTHVVVWLYAGELERVPRDVQKRLDSDALQISPAVLLELQYLFEIRRLSEAGGAVVSELRSRIGLSVSDAPFAKVVAVASTLSWTRDPFDRLIVAQARAEGVPLVTADKVIRRHCKDAVWGRARR